MKFRTEIDIIPFEEQIDYSTPLLTIGSCFASSIGGELAKSKFDIEINPFGVMFNPISICAALERMAECRLIEPSELECSGGLWFHYDFHGQFSSVSQQETLIKINNAIEQGHKALVRSEWLIITLGTAWVYELTTSQRVVANCHKQKSTYFVRRCASLSEITSKLSTILERYPSKKVLFSVSPIRHLSDGLEQNSLSKALLRVAVAEIVAKYNNGYYFPSFEILMDDLRDYRFYGDDMVHPSERAVEYIWSRFVQSLISPSSQLMMERVAKIVRAAAHRALNPASEAHLRFCREQLEAIKKMQNIDFGKESAYFESQLKN